MNMMEIKPTGPASGDVRPASGLIGDIKPVPYVDFSGPKPPKVPFWKQPGFKRGVAAVANLAAAYMMKNAKWQPAGEFMLTYVCPWLTTWAVGSAMAKSGPSHNGDDGLWSKVRQVAQRRKGN